MERYPIISFEHQTLKRGTWTPEEDQKLVAYITRYGIWNWNEMPKYAGLLRTGKSCRLRWMNYLRPGIKRGNFTKQEEETMLNLHKIMGNRWAAIAERMPQRTDNEIKNYWNTRLKKRAMENSTAAADGNDSSDQARQKNSLEGTSSSEAVSSLEDASPDAVFHSPTLGDSKPDGGNDFAEHHETDHITEEENAGNLFDIHGEIQVLLEQPMQETLEDSQTWINENFMPATSQWLYESSILCDSYYPDPADDFWPTSSI